MTREQAKAFLIEEYGIESPTSSQVSALLNKMNEENKAYALQRISEEQDKYKGYKSPDDFKKLEDEIATLKSASAKNERISKYKKANIDEAFHEFVDSQFKDSKDLDKDLEEFTKANPKFLVSTPATPSKGGASFKGSQNPEQDKTPTTGVNSPWNNKFREALGFK